MSPRKLTFKQKIIKFFTPAIFRLLVIYWFIFRPKTYGVKVVLKNKGKLLLVRHSYLSGILTFPGGGSKKNEKPEVTAKREILEELGVKLNKVHFLESFEDHSYYKKDVINVIVANVTSPELNIDPFEIKEASWFSEGELPKLGKVGQKVFNIYKKYVRD